MSLQTLGNVDRRNPINWRHPLNEGLLLRFMALPGLSGPEWLDLSGNQPPAEPGRFTFNPTILSPGGGIPALFDGSSGAGVQFTPTSNFSGSTFTWGCWVYASNDGLLWATGPGGVSGTQNGIDLGRYTYSNNLAYVNGSSWANSGVSIPQNSWHRLVVTFEYFSSHLMAYLDGALIWNYPYYSGYPILSSGQVVQIGGQGTNANLQGMIDDFFVINKVWSADQVALDYKLASQGYPGMLNRSPEPLLASSGGGGGGGSTHSVYAGNSLAIGGASSGVESVGHLVSAHSGFDLVSRALEYDGVTHNVAATSQIHVLVNSRETDNAVVNVSAHAALAMGVVSTNQQDRSVSATNKINFTTSIVARVPQLLPVSAFNSINLSTARTKGSVPHIISVSAANSLGINDLTAGRGTGKFVSAISTLDLESTTNQTPIRTWTLSAANSMVFATPASEINWAIRNVSATNKITLAQTQAINGLFYRSAANTMALGSTPKEAQDLYVSATTSLGLSPAQSYNPFYEKSATNNVTLASQATLAGVVHNQGPASIGFVDHASAVIGLPSGAGSPGGSGDGLRTLLRSDISGDFPMSYAETPNGLVLIANGVDPMLRWDAMTGSADTAGVLPPLTPVAFGGYGVGTIVGERVCYMRFIDQYGNPSILSPVSNVVEFGVDGLIDNVTYNSSGLVTITSAAHGLATGEPLVISGVEGLPINGVFTITVVDPNNFTLQGIKVTTGRYTGNGSWTLGVATVAYSGVPVSTEAKVVRRQILRNLAGMEKCSMWTSTPRIWSRRASRPP